MTLTEFSYYSRKFAPVVLICFFLVVILFYTVQLILLIPREPPDTGPVCTAEFDKLPSMEFVEATSSAKFTYVLDTIDGRPLEASATAKIHQLPSLQPRLGYPQKIFLIAKTLGFDTDTIQYTLTDGATAVFDDGQQRLDVNIATFNFTYEYDLEKDPSLFATARAEAEEVAENRAVDFLKDINRYPEELARGKTNVIYLRYDVNSNTVSVVDDPSEANMMEVDFYREDIDEYPAVTNQYFNSPHYVIMVFNDEGFKVVKAQVSFFERSTTQVSQYCLRTGAEAWEDLKKGKGFVTSEPVQNGNDVIIKKMLLGYYDPQVYEPYLQPVYVFLGENNFVGYVQAVKDEYIAGTESSPEPTQ